MKLTNESRSWEYFFPIFSFVAVIVLSFRSLFIFFFMEPSIEMTMFVLGKKRPFNFPLLIVDFSGFPKLIYAYASRFFLGCCCV